MKKLLVLLLALSFVGAYVSAQDAAPVPEAKLAAVLSGSATVAFGINLDNNATGITNAIDTNITLQLVTKATTEKGGKEGETVYGWIKLKDFEIKIDGTLSVAKPGVEAKLFLGPVYINILGDGAGTGKTLVNGPVVNDKDTNGMWDALKIGTTTSAANVEYKSLEPKQDGVDQNGIVIGLTDTSIVDVQIGVNSQYDWTVTNSTVYYLDTATGTIKSTVVSDPANTDNVYGFWAAAALKAVPGLTVEVKAGFSTLTFSSDSAKAKANPFGLGAKAGYDIAVADNIKITPVVGFDTSFFDPLTWRVSGGVNVTLPGAMMDDWDKFNVFNGDNKLDIKPGASVLFAYDSKSKADLEVTLFDGDLIPVVNVVAVGELYDLTGTMKVGIGAFATADFGAVAPWLGLETKVAPDPKSTMFQVGFDLKVITNTTITAQYDSGDLAKDPAGKGVIKFSIKIAY